MVNKIAPVVVVMLCSVALIGAGYAAISNEVSTQTDVNQIASAGAYLIDVNSNGDNLSASNTGKTDKDVFNMSLVTVYKRTSMGENHSSVAAQTSTFFEVFGPEGDTGKLVDVSIVSDKALVGVTMVVKPKSSSDGTSPLAVSNSDLLTDSATKIFDVKINTAYEITLSGTADTVAVEDFKVTLTVISEPKSAAV